jgi:hypothetical protein
MRILKPAISHPARRNALMLAVHLIWGAEARVAAATLASGMAAL